MGCRGRRFACVGAIILFGSFAASAQDYERAASLSALSSQPDCSRYQSKAHLTQLQASAFERAMAERFSISDAEEMKIAKQIFNEVKRDLPGQVVTTGREANYLRTLGQRIAKASKRPGITYRFHYVKGMMEPSAMALPGGYIFVSEGFLKEFAQNEAQLAGVLGHEIAHVELRHSTAWIGAFKRLYADDEVAMIGALVTRFLDQPYSAGKESDADKWGLQASYKAGYSAYEVSKMWDHVGSKYGRTHTGTFSLPDVPSLPQAEGMAGLALGALGQGLKVAKTVAEGAATAVMNSHPPPILRQCLAKKVAYELNQSQPRDTSVVGTRNYRQRSVVPASALP